MTADGASSARRTARRPVLAVRLPVDRSSMHRVVGLALMVPRCLGAGRAGKGWQHEACGLSIYQPRSGGMQQ
jgi:hypothetical protein